MLDVYFGVLHDFNSSYFQVIQFLESPEYNMFTRIVFDTAPTVSYPTCSQINGLVHSFNILFSGYQGHTLRLLSLPDFLDASIGKILKV